MFGYLGDESGLFKTACFINYINPCILFSRGTLPVQIHASSENFSQVYAVKGSIA